MPPLPAPAAAHARAACDSKTSHVYGRARSCREMARSVFTRPMKAMASRRRSPQSRSTVWRIASGVK